MDPNRWKSVAVRKSDYTLLKGLCKEKFRAPASMIAKLVDDYVKHLAKKEGIKIFTVLNDTGLASHGGSSQKHEAFLNLYRNREWDKAVIKAKENQKIYSELSGYYDMMIERIEHLKLDDPGKDWDTIFRATSK